MRQGSHRNAYLSIIHMWQQSTCAPHVCQPGTYVSHLVTYEGHMSAGSIHNDDDTTLMQDRGTGY